MRLITQYSHTDQAAETLLNGMRRSLHVRSEHSRAAEEEEKSPCHFNQWPNTAGFVDCEASPIPVDTPIQGNIPDYCSGVLYRVGPGRRTLTIGGQVVYRADHWFDGLAQLHKFEILPSPDASKSKPRIRYSSRNLTDDFESELTAGRVDFTFGQPLDPCQNIFQRFTTAFLRGWRHDPHKASTLNINVVPLPNPQGILPPGYASDEVIAVTTDANALALVDAQSLKTLQFTNHTALHPELRGPLCATHYAEDRDTGDRYNYNLDLGYTATYRIFRIDGVTGDSEVLAVITDAPPAYIHEICITPRCVILGIWAARFAFRGLATLYSGNTIDALEDFDRSGPCLWYVIDRTSARKGVLAIYHSRPMFVFHVINAYEEPSAVHTESFDVVIDLPCYRDLTVLQRYRYDNMASDSPKAQAFTLNGKHGMNARPRYTRYRLPDIATITSSPLREARADWSMDFNNTVELPSINPRYNGQSHRYVYGLTDTGLSTFCDSIGKVDCQSRTIQTWSVTGHTPSEPVFVANPDNEAEDAGVLLSVILDGYSCTNYLLVLDATDLKEIGRAEIGRAIHHGFHGVHVPTKLRGAKEA